MAARFQFALRNIFAATTWMAVWAAMFPLTAFIGEVRGDSHPVTVLALLSSKFLMMLLPFAAIGALLGDAIIGLLIGIPVATIAFSVVLLMLN